MIRRTLAFVLLLYAFGFLWFAAALPQPADAGRTDAIVVPTGGPGRIDRGLELLAARQANAILVTGVDREVRPAEFAAEYKVRAQTMECCVTLGFAAVDTRGNAAETAAWMDHHDYRSLRLVTTDWHMRRAAGELESALPANISVIRDAVPSRPRLGILFLEYNKLLASTAARLWPQGT
ncbi:YdcF family protein [Altererythrobacter sp. TH136]|uniref:YdcF family protein n=1 Tax=Altererythrobacter sp. TH136 TaxID=2067415 RepID=UPI0011622EF6|nr:YdcF family protein [Altererythrobacter sp. TH136]QDM40843.1 YdcF family protein [Altererythrobacter sp. TH136]